MAAEEKKSDSTKRVTEANRFRYIGFDVFPGKPKDLFKSDAEKKKYEELNQEKRSKGEILREQCTLLEERISGLDRLVLTVASIVVLLSLFLPWYSVYNEKVIETKAKPAATQSAQPADSAGAMLAPGDSTTLAAMTSDTAAMQGTTAPAATASDSANPMQGSVVSKSAGEEVLSSYIAKKKVERVYVHKSGIGGILSLGSLASYLFSSGVPLAVTAILFLINTLLCIVLPIVTLYGLYGVKGTSDARALHLKKLLRFNWVPLIVFVLALVLSFFGGDYGFNAAEAFSSIGASYGPGVLLGSISWGVVVSMGAFILIGAKGVEI